MPRPSLKDARTEEILDAMMRTVARYGLDGATLSRIAEEAGIARPMLRHYMGNREDMIAQFMNHVLARYDGITQALFEALPEQNRLHALTDILFDSPYHNSDNAAVFQALVAASDRHPEIRKPLLGFIIDFETRIATEIQHEIPNINKTNSEIVASGLVAIYFNTDAIAPLRPDIRWVAQQKQAALLLLDSL